MPSRNRKKSGRLGLALASGGLLGGVYEVGALRALEEAIGGLDLNCMDVYVGVSAGAFVGAHIANGVPVTEMLQGLRADPADAWMGRAFDPGIFFVPAFGELPRLGLQMPWTILEILTRVLSGAERPTLAAGMEGLGALLPMSVFDNQPIRHALAKYFARPGLTDDFRNLPRPLFVVATDLHTGRAVVFGSPGLDHVPISRAVQASTAVPGLYPPVEVEGRWCMDGVLLKTMHATVALKEGADLLFCINPLVPWNTGGSEAKGAVDRRALLRTDLPAVLSQCFRILIHSRVALGIERACHNYPDADLVLLEPESTEHRLFTNLFRFHSRLQVCEIGYEQTRKSLWSRRRTLEPILARHGLALRKEVLADHSRSVWDCLGSPGRGVLSVTDQLDAVLTELGATFG